MHVSAVMEYTQCLKYGPRYRFNFGSRKSFRCRFHQEIAVEVFQRKDRRISMFHFVDEWAEVRCLGLKPSQNFGVVVKSPISVCAFDDDLSLG